MRSPWPMERLASSTREALVIGPLWTKTFASQPSDKMDPTEQNASTAQATPDVNTKFEQE